MAGALFNQSKIFALDGLPIDLTFSFSCQEAFDLLIKRYHLDPDGKKPIDEGVSATLLADLKELETQGKCKFVDADPGGSSANVLVTLNRLLRQTLDIRFMGVPGVGDYGDSIRQSLKDGGITLIEPDTYSVVPKTAKTFVLNSPDGKCARATDRGNFGKIISPGMINEELIGDAEVIFVQGSLFAKTNPEVPKLLIDMGRELGRVVVLTAPTDKDLTAEDAAEFAEFIPKAEVFTSNNDELRRVYRPNGYGPIEHLQAEFYQRQRERMHTAKGMVQLGVITLGKDGIAVVTAEGEPVIISPPPLEQVLGKVGAGDAATAGFWAGEYTGLPRDASATLANVLAGHRIQRQIETRILNPEAVIKAEAESHARDLYGRLEAIIAPAPGRSRQPHEWRSGGETRHYING